MRDRYGKGRDDGGVGKRVVTNNACILGIYLEPQALFPHLFSISKIMYKLFSDPPNLYTICSFALRTISISEP